MKYSVRRFSVQEALREGNTYISAQVDSGLGKMEDLSTRIVEDPRLKDLKPIKRHGRFIRNLLRLVRKDKKKDGGSQKKYSEKDPTVSINTSEANKFKAALNRLSSSMGSSSDPVIN